MDEQNSTLHTRPSLLLRLRDSADASAWHAFADTYGPLIYGYCRRRGMQEADAADVGQDVLAQVVRSIRALDYDPRKGRFRDWLGAVVRSKIARFIERRVRDTSHAAAGGGTPTVNEVHSIGTESEWITEFNAHIVRAAMDQIRANYDEHNWRAFELTWLENRPVMEVARELKIATSAVYMAKSRILRRLREQVLVLAEDVPHLVQSSI